MPAFGAIGELPISSLRPSDVQSVLAPYTLLLHTPSDKAIFLVEAEPYDPLQASESASVIFKRFSSVGYTSKPTDSPASVHYQNKLLRQPVFSQSLSREGAVGGLIVPDFGEIELVNESGALDELLDFAWDGRSIIIKMGKETFALSEFGTVITGTGFRAVGTLRKLTIKMRSLDFRLRVPIQTNRYDGTGAAEGGDDLEGKPKPLCFGKCLNVECVLVDAPNLLFQVHDGQIEAIDAVYDNGVALSFDATPVAGEYSTDLAAGTLTLGGSAVGLITADVQGSKTGGSYKSTTGTIIRRIITEHGKQPLSDPGELDTVSFTTYETDQPAVVGIYIPPEEVDIEEIIIQLLNGAGSFAGFTRTGKFNIFVFKAPTGSASLRLTDETMLSIERLEQAPPFDFPISRISVSYERNYTVQGPDVVAGSVTDARRSFLKEARRLREDTDITVETTHLLAEEPEPIEAFFSLEANAATEATRLLALYGVDRQFLRVRALRQPFQLELHDVVRVTSARFGLSAGKDFRITSLVDNAPPGRVTMELWG